MPLIVISASQPSDQNLISRLITDVRIKSASALQCSIENIWVIYQPLQMGNYVQRQEGLKNSPIVTIKANLGRSQEQKSALASAITEAIGNALEVSTEDIWMHYEEMNPHDIWFNNQWS